MTYSNVPRNGWLKSNLTSKPYILAREVRGFGHYFCGFSLLVKHGKTIPDLFPYSILETIQFGLHPGCIRRTSVTALGFLHLWNHSCKCILRQKYTSKSMSLRPCHSIRSDSIFQRAPPFASRGCFLPRKAYPTSALCQPIEPLSKRIGALALNPPKSSILSTDTQWIRNVEHVSAVFCNFYPLSVSVAQCTWSLWHWCHHQHVHPTGVDG